MRTFLPFGQEHDPQMGTNSYKFTRSTRAARPPRLRSGQAGQAGQERDPESGLDYFGARYYGSRLARFTSTDPLMGSPDNSQSLNRYAYSLNNPLSFTDPTGLSPQNLEGPGADALTPPSCDLGPSSKACQKATEAMGQTQQGSAASALEQGWSVSWQVSASSSFLRQEVLGVWDVTGGAALGLGESVVSGEAFENIMSTVTLAVTDPGAILEAGKEAANQVGQTLSAAASGDPRAIGQVVGTAATVAYAAKNVEIHPYKNTGGGGLNIMNTPTKGSRIAFDVHKIREAGGRVRPHIDMTIKKQGVPFGPKRIGPGSNLVRIKHWPWN